MSDSMDILIVEPGKAPRPAVIPNTLDAAEKILCGSVQIGCFNHILYPAYCLYICV